MKIHLLDTVLRPEKGNLVTANCGKKLIFYGSVGTSFDDGRVHDECLSRHREKPLSLYCFGFIEFETGEEANQYSQRTGYYPPLTPRNRQQQPISISTSR